MDNINLNSTQLGQVINDSTNVYTVLTCATYNYLNRCPSDTIKYFYVLNIRAITIAT